MTTVEAWNRGFSADALGDVAALWNRSARTRHAFFPWTGDLLYRRWRDAGRFDPLDLIAARDDDGELVGIAHVSAVNEPFYDPAGAVEALFVRPDRRRNGIGARLLAAALKRLRGRRLGFVDFLGAWPYGPLYTTLADGSERSGAFGAESAPLARAAGFRCVRESIVMRLDLADAILPVDPDARVSVDRRPREGGPTWLDRVFTGWRLFDHAMLDADGRLLSRAIFSRMEGVSDWVGREVYALFGVHTPPELRGRGYAFRNIGAVLSRLHAAGTAVVELHVYADNVPALRLYGRLGFREVARTSMWRLTL